MRRPRAAASSLADAEQIAIMMAIIQEAPVTTYSVAEAKNGLPRLIDKMLEGEEVVITRHGKPVAELRPTNPRTPSAAEGTYEWLRSRRVQRPRVNLTSVELLDLLYEDD